MECTDHRRGTRSFVGFVLLTTNYIHR